ncbi:AAA family ATPase [Microbulbifer sp.]|uniref:AAA family ATPase n=1 Tax=Microbulbifer sp. TaxID=1908541 RepID=UPI002585CE4F|nr:AAA family ATPase [Microbulbifer sp.]
MWHPNAKFPDKLRSESAQERMDYFKKGFVLKHDSVINTYDCLSREFFDSSEQFICLVSGPTGVGKTCLSSMLMKNAYKNIETEGGRVSELPMVYTEADVLGGAKFSWRDFYSNLLAAMGEPNSIKIYASPRAAETSKGRRYNSRGRSEGDLKKDLLDRISKYRVEYIVIDEIQHVFKYGGQDGEKNLDILKGIANRSGCRFIGLGTYEISYSLERSGQLSRRVHLLDYPAYSVDAESDVKSFTSAYLGLMAHLPIELDPRIGSMAREAFLGSCGCIGTLKEWLDRALKRAFNENSNVLTIEHLKASRLKASQLRHIAEEIREGKSFIEEPDDAEIWEILGSNNNRVPSKSKESRRKSGSKTPGRRLPNRDDTG